MVDTEVYNGEERRSRDRARGIVLRRRRNALAEGEVERRRAVNNSFDIASALELHLDEHKTRRAMLGLLESWLTEGKSADPAQRDDSYIAAVEHAIQVIKTSPDVTTGVAILQRAPDDS